MRRFTPLLGIVALVVAAFFCVRLGSRATDVLEVCGLGSVRIAAGAAAENQFARELAHQAETRWFKALDDSRSPRAQASRWAMAAVAYDTTSEQQHLARVQLAQLALSSLDPVAYGLALDLCGEEDGRAPPCSELSWDKWAELDPDNGAPWLKLAALAHERKDAAGEAAAFDRLSRASTLEFYSRLVALFAEPYAPKNASALERRLMSFDTNALTLRHAWQYGQIARLCSGKAVAEPQARSRCDAIAALLIDHPGDLSDLAFGRLMAGQLGWSEDRLAPLNTRVDALLAAGDIETAHLDLSRVYSCGEVEAANARLDEEARLGYVGAATARLQRSGFSAQQLALKWRTHREEQRREAQAAACKSAPDCACP